MTEPFDDPDARPERPRDPSGSAFGPAADPMPSSQPQFAPSATGFATWLVHQPDMTARFAEDAMNTFEGVLFVMRDRALRPDVPQHVAQFIELMIADEIAGEADPQIFDEVLDVIDDYVHFRIENSRDPEEWEDVHELLEDAIDARDDDEHDNPLHALLDETDPVPDDVKLRAYAQLPILRAVPDLLAWMGTGCVVTATGALRRTDIERVAGLLGIRAHGTNEPWSPRLNPDAPIAARSMSDVPLLEAWWEALQTADVIERDRSRMRPGAAAESTSTALSVDLAEEVIAYCLANVVTGSASPAQLAGDVAAATIARILVILDPERMVLGTALDEPRSINDDLVERLAESRMADLAAMGLLTATPEGGWTVAEELHHVVARATVLAATLSLVDDDDFDDGFDEFGDGFDDD